MDSKELGKHWMLLNYNNMKTLQMKEYETEINVNNIITLLNHITDNLSCVDGETLQYIIEKVGMKEQMLRQLMMSSNLNEVSSLYNERKTIL